MDFGLTIIHLDQKNLEINAALALLTEYIADVN
jgi:hypothetical protein